MGKQRTHKEVSPKHQRPSISKPSYLSPRRLQPCSHEKQRMPAGRWTSNQGVDQCLCRSCSCSCCEERPRLGFDRLFLLLLRLRGSSGVAVVAVCASRRHPVATVDDVGHSGGRDPHIGVLGYASVDAEGVNLFNQSHKHTPCREQPLRLLEISMEYGAQVRGGYSGP